VCSRRGGELVRIGDGMGVGLCLGKVRGEWVARRVRGGSGGGVPHSLKMK